MDNNDKLIIVVYVGVKTLRSEDIEDYIQKLTSRIVPTTIEGEFIMIPVDSVDTRIECINPKYITDENLINEHTEIMKRLQEQLRYQSEQLKG